MKKGFFQKMVSPVSVKIKEESKFPTFEKEIAEAHREADEAFEFFNQAGSQEKIDEAILRMRAADARCVRIWNEYNQGKRGILPVPWAKE